MKKRGRPRREPRWWELVKVEALWSTGGTRNTIAQELGVRWSIADRWVREVKRAYAQRKSNV